MAELVDDLGEKTGVGVSGELATDLCGFYARRGAFFTEGNEENKGSRRTDGEYLGHCAARGDDR